jgi:hypothetical protein
MCCTRGYPLLVGGHAQQDEMVGFACAATWSPMVVRRMARELLDWCFGSGSRSGSYSDPTPPAALTHTVLVALTRRRPAC